MMISKDFMSDWDQNGIKFDFNNFSLFYDREFSEKIKYDSLMHNA